MKVGLIRNPWSGRGAGEQSWRMLEPKLRARLRDSPVESFETTGPGSAREQARALASQGFELVIAAGGDGTVSEVMQGILGTPTALAILPLGTGNDLARSLRVGPSLDSSLGALESNARRRIDVAHWQLDDREGHFVNVAGCGFDAAVADRVNRRYRRLHGRTAYLAAVLATLRSYKPTLLRISVDEEWIERKAMLCALANAKCYGGGMLIAPHADLQDGWLDLVLVGQLSRLQFILNFPRVLKGAHLSHPAVEHRRFRSATIESIPPAPFLIDGELLPPGVLKVDVVPNALEVVAPSI